MTDPTPEDGPFTFINVFDIDESEIDTFVAQWEERSAFMTSADGFVSAELHRAFDPDTRFRLVNVTRFASVAQFEAVTQDPGYAARLGSDRDSLSWTANRGFYRTAAKFG